MLFVSGLMKEKNWKSVKRVCMDECGMIPVPVAYLAHKMYARMELLLATRIKSWSRELMKKI